MKVQWQVRPLRRSDGRRLRAFRCAATAERWATEVQEFIADALLAWCFDKRARANDPRVLLLLKGRELVGVAAHELVTLRDPSSARSYRATKLVVLALSTKWHGHTFSDGRRASDVLFDATLTDIDQRRPERGLRVLAKVHMDNVRSLHLCRRHGLDIELSLDPADPDYLRLVTAPRS